METAITLRVPKISWRRLDPRRGTRRHCWWSSSTGAESVASSITHDSVATAGTKRRRNFNDACLDPHHGALRRRLTFDHHFPKTKKKTHYCNLHYWATGVKVKGAKVLTCKKCDVSLCTDYCWETFHRVWDLKREKFEIILPQIPHPKMTKKYRKYRITFAIRNRFAF